MADKFIKEVFDGFNSAKALVIGDVMIDSYLWGKVERISPEAPVPIVSVSKRENRLGGAANVALNIQALGAIPVLCSVIGDDLRGEQFFELLQQRQMPVGGLVKSKSRMTTVKFRVIGNNHQLLRVDEEQENEINAEEQQELYRKIEAFIKNDAIKVIIFEDYDKGVITEALINKVVKLAKQYQIPVTVDPKKKNFLYYKEVSLFKPNLKELREGLKVDISAHDKSTLEMALAKLHERLMVKYVLLTMSEHGVVLSNKDFELNKLDFYYIPAHLRNIADVSGAGDTVISVASLCLAQNLDIYRVAAIANLSGGIVCEEVGAVAIDKEKLLQEVELHLNC